MIKNNQEMFKKKAKARQSRKYFLNGEGLKPVFGDLFWLMFCLGFENIFNIRELLFDRFVMN